MDTMTDLLTVKMVIVYDLCDASGACIQPFTPQERGDLDAITEAAYIAAFPGCEWHSTTTPYALVETNAPQAYDYGYTVDLGVDEMTTRTGIIRLVAMPVERVEYQCGRYMSGLYLVRMVEVA